jgi:hypothetical protein
MTKVKRANNVRPEKESVVQAPSAKATMSKMTVAQEIWFEIRNKSAPMFGLPDQKFSQYLKFHPLSPEKCYMISKASSILPMLEETFKDKFEFETVSKYIVATKKSQ